MLLLLLLQQHRLFRTLLLRTPRLPTIRILRTGKEAGAKAEEEAGGEEGEEVAAAAVGAEEAAEEEEEEEEEECQGRGDDFFFVSHFFRSFL